MAISSRLDPFDLSRDVLVAAGLSPAEQAKMFQAVARDELAKGQALNRAATGQVPPHVTIVDQKRGAVLESAKADSTVVFEFELIETALAAIGEMLVRHSPVRSGRFQDSWILFADGDAVVPGAVPSGAQEYAFVNSQPYARKIEKGLSPQAPDGVAEAVATLAQRRWGNIARVTFTFRSPVTGVVFGAANRAERTAMRSQPARRAAIRMERATRAPAVVVRPK